MPKRTTTTDACRPTTKHEPLRPSDVDAFVVAEPFFRNLDALRARLDPAPERLRVLDWGCGRGTMVLKLRRAGFDAYGLDVDAPTLDRGRPLLESEGVPDDTLRLWHPDGPPPFEDASFHAIVSDQVMEHVGPLDDTLRAMHRLLLPGGIALHQFPSRHRIVEPHLRMPLIHWLPKGRVRRCAIHAMCALGVGTVWKETEHDTPAERASRYADYSEEHTFYRSRRELRRAAHNAGFACRFWGWGSTSKTLRLMRRVPVLRELRQRYQLSLITTWMLLTRGA